MPGGPDREIPIPVRRFQGTMLAIDPAFVPLGWLTQCDNWMPDPTYVLTKRRGGLAWQTLPGAGRVDPLVYTSDSLGNRYVYAVASDRLYCSVNDGAFVAVANGAFATPSPRYAALGVGDQLYCGNDSDPLKQVPLGGAAIDLGPLALADDTGATITWTDDPNSNLLAGSYSYRWATYNATTKRWVKIGPVRVATTVATTRQRLNFRAPTTTLATNELWHLFAAGVDQEIEGAHDQTPAGLPSSSGADQFSLWDQPTIDTAVVPIPSTVVRHGSHLAAHRGCVWGAGGVGAPTRRVWATSVLVPGLEQAAFDQGVFFPAAAVSPDLGDPVTALAVVTQSSGQAMPSSPLALFTEVSTWLFSGDLVNDPTAELVQISGEVGCVSDRTCVATPSGMVFVGKRSVYLIAAAAAEPRDIGWPIENAIRAIPVALRSRIFAIYHRGFYKLAVVPTGGTEPTQQWWLDLRRGLGDPPNWWGPFTMPAYTASTRAPDHPSEEDRGWGVLTSPGQVEMLDQPDRYVEADGTPIVSRLTTPLLDGGAPLTPKLAKRARVVARVDGPSSLGVTVSADDAQSASGVLLLPTAVGAEWNTSEWDVSEWASLALNLVEFECPVPEPRGRAFQATLTHADAVQCDLRDFELRVQPSFRETL
jgi:hypothetical protein